MKTSAFLTAILILAAWATPAQADAVGFTAITNNSGQSATIAAQFSVTVAPFNATTWNFTFANAGPVASTIAGIYIDASGTGTTVSALSHIEATSAGVSFVENGNPQALPSEGNAVPPFVSDAENLSATPPPATNGIDPGESLTWHVFFSGAFDAHAALHAGTLRFGIHVISIGRGQESDSFVTGPGGNVPEPSLMFLTLGAGAVVFFRRRRR